MVTVPEFLYQFRVGGIEKWAHLRELLEPWQGLVCAGLSRGQVIAMGSRADIQTCFGTPAGGSFDQAPVAPSDLFWSDGTVISVLREGLVRALAADGLAAAQEGRRWYVYDPTEKRTTWDGRSVVYHDAVEVHLEQRAKTVYLSLIPDRYIPRDRLPEGTVGLVKASLVARQWNQVFNEELNQWRKRLKLGEPRHLVFPPGNETGFRYVIDRGPVLTQRFEKGQGKNEKPPGNAALYRFKAIELGEPDLQFHDGTDMHPIRGLLHLGPAELSITDAHVAKDVRIGVVCPKGASQGFHRFLVRLVHRHPAVESKQEYLEEYPGFLGAFRVPLHIPTPMDDSWVQTPDLPRSHDPIGGFQEILQQITGAIDRLAAGPRVDSVIIYIPSNWSPFEVVETETIDLDLHDQIKAYCAARGIRTQLLRERTLAKRHQAEVLWWLALALYAKSFRTPWVLAGAPDDAAFVGVGLRRRPPQPGTADRPWL